jgi:hypothetical protein
MPIANVAGKQALQIISFLDTTVDGWQDMIYNEKSLSVLSHILLG